LGISSYHPDGSIIMSALYGPTYIFVSLLADLVELPWVQMTHFEMT